MIPERHQSCTETSPPGSWRSRFADHPLWVLAGVLVVLVIVTGIIEPRYLSPNGIRNTVLLAAPLGIMAGAQTILMLTGGIDLSVGMVATAAAYVAGNQSPRGAAIAILLGLGVGVVAGAINGVGVGVFRVNPLIMTLAMSAILLGLFTALSFTVLQGSTTVAQFIKTLGGGSFLNNLIPYNAVVWAVVSLVIIYGLRRTGLGRLLYAVGDNAIAVRLAGVRIWQVQIAAYTLAGVLAALAGILLAGRTGRGRPAAGGELLAPFSCCSSHRGHIDIRRRGLLFGNHLRRAHPRCAGNHAHLPRRRASGAADRVRVDRSRPGLAVFEGHRDALGRRRWDSARSRRPWLASGSSAWPMSRPSAVSESKSAG